jgi:(2R)-3-sulfolactate dehydrogenase (NADP+)
MMERLSLSDVHDLTHDCLTRAGAPERVAQAVASEVTASEALGDRHHGLEALLRDIRLMRYGRIDATAPAMQTRPRPGLMTCDAAHGFAAAALDICLAALMDMARDQGIAMLRLDRASDPGAMIHATQAIARQGLAALAHGSGGMGRFAHPDDPVGGAMARQPLGPLTPTHPHPDGQPDDSPLGGPVAHGAWIMAWDIATETGPLLSAEIRAMLTPPPSALDIALPTDLLERIVTA